MQRIIQIFRDSPIPRKITFVILLTCATSLAVTAAAIFVAQLITFRHSFNRDLEATGKMIGQTATATIVFKDRQGAGDILASVSAKPHILRALLELPDGSPFATFQQKELDNEPSAPPGDGAHFAGPYLVLNQGVVLAGERIATLRLICDYQREYSRSLQLYAGIIGSVLFVSVLLALGLSNRLQRLISAPVLSLADTARTVADRKDYSVRAPVRFQDEVGELTTAFNQMLERIQAQDEALTRSQRKLEALVHSIDGIVWECAPDTFQFTFVSRQAERILGYTPEEWLASPSFWHDHVHPDDAVRAVDVCRLAIARREAYNCEYRMLAADKRVVWIRESGVVLVEHDKASAVRGIFMDITAQRQAAEELDKLNRQLMTASRHAGMAEVATGVLHNVGNVLNSVNVSVNLISDQLGRSQAPNLAKLAALLENHRADLGTFLTEDPKGRRIPDFVHSLSAAFEEERQQFNREMQTLRGNVAHIKEIVAMQQSYAKVAGVIEDLPPASLLEDAIRMNEGAFQRHGVTVQRDFQRVPMVRVDRHKTLQILVNLLRNAKYALDAAGKREKVLTLSLLMNGSGRVKVMVKDNGVGIAPENLTRIFGHGFTTKKDGHGFGLHSGANAAKEMGGSLQAFSDGPGMGATFVLELPVAAPRENN